MLVYHALSVLVYHVLIYHTSIYSVIMCYALSVLTISISCGNAIKLMSAS